MNKDDIQKGWLLYFGDFQQERHKRLNDMFKDCFMSGADWAMRNNSDSIKLKMCVEALEKIDKDPGIGLWMKDLAADTLKKVGE